VNLPKDCSQEEISNVFLEAYKRGIIGVTVYRDRCREGILIHETEKKENKIIQRHAPKRPEELLAHIYRITVKGEKWIVFIGLYENSPYEIFAGKVKLVDIPSFINDGLLIRSDKGIYQFKYENDIIISDISKLFECGEQESITRLISTSLRHGVPIKYIQQQLSKSYGNITDFNKSILRAFKKYLKEEDTNEVCEVCGSKIIYVEGCKKCSNPECFWSKCG
jgi:ribonucleoside-diphosphate reductase alpha chain